MINKHYSIEHYFLIKNIQHDKDFDKIEVVCEKTSCSYGESYFVEVNISSGVNQKYFHHDVIEDVINQMDLK